ncbi:hypothetical protein D9M72_524460 [compost metagenome]
MNSNVFNVPPGQQGDQRSLGHRRAEDFLQDGLRNLLAAFGLGAIAAGHQLEGVLEGPQFMGGGAREAGAEGHVLGVVHG